MNVWGMTWKTGSQGEVGLFDWLEEEGKGELEILSHFFIVGGKADNGNEIKHREILEACLDQQDVQG